LRASGRIYHDVALEQRLGHSPRAILTVWRHFLIRKEEISTPRPRSGEGRSCNSGEQAEILPCLGNEFVSYEESMATARRYDFFWLFSTPLATNRGWSANNSFDFAADLPRIQDFCRPSRSWIRHRNLWRLAFLLYCRWFYPILDLSTLICTWSFCTAGIRNGLTNWQRPAIVLLAVKYKRERRLLSSIRILVVDDHEGWRRKVCQLLQVRPEYQVIGEASDGSEAVQRAEELKPDLIVLDIGLPKLNGIEAARQIRQRSPSSKIVFLSLNNDLDVVWAVLGTGNQKNRNNKRNLI